MKLISCHVENFGRLSGFDTDFDAHLTLFCEQNGWGKSTLAAFLKAMLYGLKGDRKRSVQENERKRFAPWQGGPFGGSLRFAAGGKGYTVTRLFGEKEADDFFELRETETNRVSGDFGPELGRELFRIDAASFERTVFISQNDCAADSAATDDMNALISHLSDHTDDMNNFESADRSLKEEADRLGPQRSGRLKKLREQKAAKAEEVRRGAHLVESLNGQAALLSGQRERLAELEAREKELIGIQEEALKVSEALAERSLYERIYGQYEAEQEKFKTVSSFFPGAIPRPEEVGEAERLCDDLRLAESEAARFKPTEEDRQLLSLAEGRFGGEEAFRTACTASLEQLRELKTLRRRAEDDRLTFAEQRQWTELAPLFENRPSASAVKTLRSEQESWSAKAAGLAEREKAAREFEGSAKKRRFLSRTLLILGILLLMAGALWILRQTGVLLTTEERAAIAEHPEQAPMSTIPVWLGPVSAGAGLLLAVFGLAVGRKKPEGSPEETAAELGEQRRKAEEEAGKRGREVDAYFRQLGLQPAETEIWARLTELSEQEKVYLALGEKRQIEKEHGYGPEADRLEAEIRQFLAAHGAALGEDETPDDGFAKLREDFASYLELKKKRQSYEGAMRREKDCRAAILQWLRRFGFREDGQDADRLKPQIRRIYEQVLSYDEEEKDARAAETEWERFEAEHDVARIRSLAADAQAPDTKALAEQLSALRKEHEALRTAAAQEARILDKMQEEFDSHEQAVRELADLEAETAETAGRYEVVSKARTFLTQAKEAVTARYAAPIRNAFRKYYSLLEAGRADVYTVGADAAVTVSELGRQREQSSLSAGYRDLVGFCLRLALADAMYPGEKPMLIMDDPFVNLDERKTSAAMGLLGEAAKDYQIIYFTCHGGRMPE